MIKVKQLIKNKKTGFNLTCYLLVFILVLAKLYGNYHNTHHQQENNNKYLAIPEKSNHKECNICYLDNFQQKIKLANIFQLLGLINIFLLISKKYYNFILQHHYCWYLPCAPPSSSKIYL